MNILTISFRCLLPVFVLFTTAGCPGRATGGKGEAEVEQQGDTVPVERRISAVFGGDVMQHMQQIGAARRDSTFDYSECFQYLKPIFDTTDIVVLNLETTVSADGRYAGYPRFASPPQIVDALKDCGADVLLLANNHICDWGRKGIEATIARIKEAGMEYTGAFADSAEYSARNPLYIERNGIKLALLNYSYGTNGMPIPRGCVVNLIDTAAIGADLAKIDRSSTDHIIVCLHWGIEYARTPGNKQRELAAWLHSRGVEVIAGGHPHVIQPLEVILDSLSMQKNITAYSLGNVVSNQRNRYTDGGMLLNISFVHNDTLAPRIEAGHILTWVYRPWKEGRVRYMILPEMVADTILADDLQAAKAYNLFIQDSRAILR